MIRVLEVALPQRVLALQRRDRVHGVGAADRSLAGLGEAEEAHLALANEVGHRAHDVLDRHGGIDAVLVEQVDVVGAEAAQRALDRLADVLRPAVDADHRFRPSMRKPNLVAMTTPSRRPLSARPSSSSLV